MIRAFVSALQLLTRLPTPILNPAPRPEELGQSVLFFPVVGLLIGALLVGLHTMPLRMIDPGVSAVLLLAVWVLITGGLHLDGLADSADAWIGGQGDRDRTLAIMKDPRSGPMAITVVVLVLLGKFAALQVLLPTDDASMILLSAPILGRTIIVLLLITTPYVRPDGLGAPYAKALPRFGCGSLILLIAVAVITFMGWRGVILIAALSIVFFILRRGFVVWLGGVTGDTLGAACESAETVTLLIAAAMN